MGELINLQEERQKRAEWPKWCFKGLFCNGKIPVAKPEVEIRATGKFCSFCGKKLNKSEPGDQNAPAS